MNHVIAAGVALAVMVGAYNLFLANAEKAGVVKERARVEIAEKKVDEKIQKARRAAASRPAASVLDRWSAD
tara:strand:+ start:298 stop:510 length:213 start_codon:yes stop_codon:yes gene_type:complete